MATSSSVMASDIHPAGIFPKNDLFIKKILIEETEWGTYVSLILEKNNEPLLLPRRFWKYEYGLWEENKMLSHPLIIHHKNNIAEEIRSLRIMGKDILIEDKTFDKNAFVLSTYGGIKITQAVEHEVFYQQSMLLNKPFKDLFYTHTVITSARANRNFIYLKAFLNDSLFSYVQKKQTLREFSQHSWLFCTWMRLLPKHLNHEALDTLHAFLFDIYEDLSDEQEKKKFVADDMMPGEALTRYQEKQKNIFYRALDQLRRYLKNKDIKESYVQTLITQLADWVQDFRDSHLSLVYPALTLKDQLRFFIDQYHFFVERIKPKLSSAFYEELKNLARHCVEEEMRLPAAPIHYMIGEERNISLFNNILNLRLLSTWTAAMTLYSGYAQYYNSHIARAKAGAGIVEGVLHLLPVVGGIAKIVNSTSSLFQLLDENHSLFEMVGSSVSAFKVCLEGIEVIESHYLGYKNLCRLFVNLGINGKEYIETISTAFCSRYEKQINLFGVTQQKQLIDFAEDTARFILLFLTSTSLTKKERDEFLVPLLIIWCARHTAEKGSKLRFMNDERKEITITSGDLLSRVQIESKTSLLGASPFLPDKISPLPLFFKQAKAAHIEIMHHKKPYSLETLQTSLSLAEEKDISELKIELPHHLQQRKNTEELKELREANKRLTTMVESLLSERKTLEDSKGVRAFTP